MIRLVLVGLLIVGTVNMGLSAIGSLESSAQARAVMIDNASEGK